MFVQEKNGFLATVSSLFVTGQKATSLESANFYVGDLTTIQTGISLKQLNHHRSNPQKAHLQGLLFTTDFL